MSDLEGKYVVVLDRWAEEYGRHWPVTAVFDTLAAARAMDAHDCSNPSPLPKADWAGRREGRTELLAECTGETEGAEILRLERRSDD